MKYCKMHNLLVVLNCIKNCENWFYSTRSHLNYLVVQAMTLFYYFVQQREIHFCKIKGTSTKRVHFFCCFISQAGQLSCGLYSIRLYQVSLWRGQSLLSWIAGLWSYFSPSSQDLELFHLIITAAKGVFDFHVPSEHCLVSENEILSRGAKNLAVISVSFIRKLSLIPSRNLLYCFLSCSFALQILIKVVKYNMHHTNVYEAASSYP